jgi:hypothetical protein
MLSFVLLLTVSSLTACKGAQTAAPTALAASSGEPTPVVQRTTEPTVSEPPPEGAKRTTILLMGAGEADFSTEQNPNALTHILITLDPDNRVVKLTTLPYNLAVMAFRDGEALERMQLQQICSAMGPEGAVETIERNFDISVDHWIVMNMLGVVDVVDALNGLKIDVDRLSINEAAQYLMPLLDLTWVEVKSLGLQTLSGVQVLGFFCDTVPEDTDHYIYGEELLFRDRHPKIINAVAAAVKLGGLTAGDLVNIAGNLSDRQRYITDISQDEWTLLAETLLYCADNPLEFLHVPEEIEVTRLDNGWESIAFDEEKDVRAVVAFIGES